jgi:hypothetical protein
MAIVRGTAFFVNKGPDRCWTFVMAWDNGTPLTHIDDSIRVVSVCERAPVAMLRGSGICAAHLKLQQQRKGGGQ